MTLATGIVALALLQAAAPLERAAAHRDRGRREGRVRSPASRATTWWSWRRASRAWCTRFEPDTRPIDLARRRRHQPADGDALPPERGRSRPAVPRPAARGLAAHGLDHRRPADAAGADSATTWRRAPTRAEARGAAGGNTLLDALVEAARDLEGREGRRAVVIAVTGTGIGFADRDRRRGGGRGRRQTGAQFLAVQFDESGDPEVQAAGGGQVRASTTTTCCPSCAKRSGGRHERVLSALAVAQGARRSWRPISAVSYRLSYAAGAASRTQDSRSRSPVPARPRAGASDRPSDEDDARSPSDLRKDTMMRHALALLLVLSTAAAPPPSQRRAPRRSGSGSRSSTCTVSVTDSRSRYVTDLKTTDFAVFEDGIQQDLSHLPARGHPDLARRWWSTPRPPWTRSCRTRSRPPCASSRRCGRRTRRR